MQRCAFCGSAFPDDAQKGTITAFPIPTAGSSLSAITADPDGNLWLTEYTGNKIGRIVAGLARRAQGRWKESLHGALFRKVCITGMGKTCLP